MLNTNNRIGQQVIPTYIKSPPCKISIEEGWHYAWSDNPHYNSATLHRSATRGYAA